MSVDTVTDQSSLITNQAKTLTPTKDQLLTDNSKHINSNKRILNSSPPTKILKTSNSFQNSRIIASQNSKSPKKEATPRKAANAQDNKSQQNTAVSSNLSNLNIIQDSNMSTDQPNNNDIDESLYSRQLYVLGHAAMQRMQNSNVFISGLRALGIEIAKNVILGGVKSCTIHDPASPNIYDLSAQYFVQSSDLSNGKSRAEICLPKLAELNSYVPLTISTDLSHETLKNFQVVVLTNSSHSERLEIGEFCHDNGIKFISCCMNGLAGGIFCDFGEEHVVYDSNGEACKSVMVAKVHQEDDKWLVTCLDESRHGFESGDWVEFREVQGLEGLHGNKFEINVRGPFNFEFKANCEITGSYSGGGIVSQVKVPTVMKYKSLKSSFDQPECMITDFAKFERPAQLHAWFEALDKSGKTHAETTEEAKEILKLSNTELPEDVFIPLTITAAGQLVAMSAVLGGIAAQEVMKSITGKFTPINQYCYFDAIECLGDERTLPDDICHDSGRYTGQTCVFGKKCQERINTASIFCVGSGAIGCELLKSMAMMGISSADGAQLTVTDMDTIEKSNLNRQFLFRPWDVGQMKGTVAAKAVKVMNPEVNIVAHQNRVGPETQNIYDDTFFEGLTCVTNALDNVDARMYMDRRCIYYKKPLFESGTLGTMGNVQVVLPHITESYSSSHDPPEKGIPICTLKNFPNAIEHTLQWARDQFEGIFRNDAEVANQYLQDPQSFFARTKKLPGSEPVTTLLQVEEALATSRPSNFKECVHWARIYFESQYGNQIKQLLYNFPPDQLTSSGAKFWSGPKRCPTPATFSLDNSTHLDYLIAVSHLRAQMYQVDIPENSSSSEFLSELLSDCVVKAFSAKKGVKIAANDSELQAENNSQQTTDEDEFGQISARLPDVSEFGKWRLCPHDFEKDDDTNRHIDFIVASSNVRARNYSIEEADRYTSKKIAGKIIPAIATTTGLVVGLVGLEMYKYMNKAENLETYKNGFINLALPFFGFSEPIKAATEKYYDIEWSLWDRFEVNGLKPDGTEMNLQELLDYFTNDHKLEVIMLSSGVSMIFSFFMNKKSREERMKMPVSRAVEIVSKKEIKSNEKYMVLEICANDTEGEDVEVPYIRYRFR